MTTDFDHFLDLLKILIRHPSVVGSEHSFFRVLQRELEEIGVTVTRYEGLLVAQGNRPREQYLSAHIDRHGLVCTGPNEFQYAAFVASYRGDLLGNSLEEQTFNTIAGRFHDQPVIAYEPWSGVYRGTGKIDRVYLCPRRKNMVFEVNGLEHMVAGTPVAFRDRLRIHKDLLIGQLDNVLSAAMIVHLFEAGYQGTAFFTAQEEAGRSWRFLLEWFQRFEDETNRLIVLDTSPYSDRVSADQQQVVLRRRDANGMFDVETVGILEETCKEHAISYTFKDEYIEKQNISRQKDGLSPLSYGSTELGRIVAASNGLVRGATLQMPTTGYHTTEETASIASCEAFLKLLKAISIKD